MGRRLLSLDPRGSSPRALQTNRHPPTAVRLPVLTVVGLLSWRRRLVLPDQAWARREGTEDFDEREARLCARSSRPLLLLSYPGVLDFAVATRAGGESRSEAAFLRTGAHSTGRASSKGPRHRVSFLPVVAVSTSVICRQRFCPKLPVWP